MLFFSVFSLLASCTKEIIEKETENKNVSNLLPIPSNENLRALPEDCPTGTHAVLQYNFDEFHFHRPRRSCQSGFWFCTVGGSWEVNCVANTNSLLATINGNSAFVWAKELESNQIEIHFPIALKDTESYSAEDLAVFNVDEEYEIYNGITLKEGEYSVVETENELVVVVDYL